MKKLVIAMDSFKGSLSSIDAAQAVERGFRVVYGGEGKVVKLRIADGGEGTVDTLVANMHGQHISIRVHDPLIRPIEAVYGIVNQDTAIIEIASACGLTLLKNEERNPMITTSYGIGEIIADALKRGCSKFMIGIGGSATNDAGVGMLQALGFTFADDSGIAIGKGGKELIRINSIDDTCVIPELKQALFTVACDVNNPFTGINGAAHVFAPQKGADKRMVELLDEGMKHLAQIIKADKGIDLDTISGSGAAGGIGGGMVAFLNATLVSGIEMILKAIDFERHIVDADLIITGEGKIDSQTMMGKTLYGILNAASRHNIPVIALTGSVENQTSLDNSGFAGIFPILPSPVTLEKAMNCKYTAANIERTTIQVLKTLKSFGI